jgi:hypothetical protein
MDIITKVELDIKVEEFEMLKTRLINTKAKFAGVKKDINRLHNCVMEFEAELNTKKPKR